MMIKNSFPIFSLLINGRPLGEIKFRLKQPSRAEMAIYNPHSSILPFPLVFYFFFIFLIVLKLPCITFCLFVTCRLSLDQKKRLLVGDNS